MISTTKEIQFASFLWIDLTNPGKAELRELAARYHLDVNLVHDSLQHGHLPKLERLEQYSFLILRSYTAVAGDRITKHGELSNKIAFFMNSDRLITIHRKEFKFLQISKTDYRHPQELFLDIAYAMIQSFGEPVKLQAERIDQFERTLFLRKAVPISLEDLYFQKIKARICRKLLLLTQSVMNQLQVDPDFQTKLQDVKDELVDSVLQYDEILDDANNLLHMYVSLTAQRSNDVMKLLTVFSAFFLPLTFIVGIYGMNFEHMPELKWANGYYYSLGLMILVSLFIYLWFRRQKIM